MSLCKSESQSISPIGSSTCSSTFFLSLYRGSPLSRGVTFQLLVLTSWCGYRSFVFQFRPCALCKFQEKKTYSATSVMMRPSISACRHASKQFALTSRRCFSQSGPRSKEISDAYIISAVRTPVAVVRGLELSCMLHTWSLTTTRSLMAPSPRFRRPVSVPTRSRKQSHAQKFQQIG